MQRRLIVAIFLAAVMGLPVLAQTPSLIAAAIADSTRPAKDIALDATRDPADLIAFAKVKPGDTVVDVWPGAGYWSRLFSDVVGAKGEVYAYVPTEIAGFKSEPIAQAKAINAEPGHANVEEVSDPWRRRRRPNSRRRRT